MLESQYQTKLLQKLKPHGWFHKVHDTFKAGIPDIVGVVSGIFVAIELKVDDRKVTPLQWWTLQQIAAEGGYAQIVRYNNKTRKHYIGSNEFDKLEEVVECILKQSLLLTSSSVLKWPLQDPTSRSSSSRVLVKQK